MPNRKSSPKIYFHFQYPVNLKNRERLKKFIEAIFVRESTGLKELHYIFCSDKYLLKLNKQFLKHDFLTDILTFNLSEKDPEITAEAYISSERVKENSKKFKTSFSREILRVVFHGALHLCGYRDKTVEEQKIIRQKEELLIKLFQP